MAAAKKKVVKETVNTHQCEFCSKAFKYESGLLKHACEQKKRWLVRDEKYVRNGLYAFQKFYEISMRSKKTRTYDDFINSSYYQAFVDFGKYIQDINAIEPMGFIEYLIREQINLKNWSKEENYERWVREIAKKESPQRAIERNILLMEQWSRDTGEPWPDFFRKVSTNLATRWIRTGRISPWLLYTPSGNALFDRMTDEQLMMVKDWINPLFWSDKVKKHKEEMDYIKEILQHAGV